MTLSTDQHTYRAGHAVTLSLSVTNPFKAPVTLTCASAQGYDFLIAAATGQHERWHRSDGKAFTQIGNSHQFAPHSTVTFTGVWDQRDKAGQPAPPGGYVVTGHLSATVAVDAPLIITIRQPHEAPLLT